MAKQRGTKAGGASSAADSAVSAQAAGKALVIVESPAKAKTIEKYLGAGYMVRSCFGHVRDLSKGRKGAKAAGGENGESDDDGGARAKPKPRKKGRTKPSERPIEGVDIKNDFHPTYEVIAEKAKVIRELKGHLKKASMLYLAPDPDREGEAIAWHLSEVLRFDPERTFRVTFNEITPKATRAAFEHPSRLNMDRVNAQQARRILDRIVGFKLSPLLCEKLRSKLSAGRVQSVAVRLIVEREREIAAFKAVEYWRILAFLRHQQTLFEAELRTVDGKKAGLGNLGEAQSVMDRFHGATTPEFRVTDVEVKEVRSRPSPPFATSQLQQAASSRLGFPAQKTMRVAQQLYEGIDLGAEGSVGLITYMRTDSFRLSNDSLEDSRGFIGSQFGAEYLPEKPNVYRSNKGAQEAHEAIRPTSARRTPESLRNRLDKDQFRLYQLIWKRFIASQMMPAVFEQTGIDIEAAGCGFRAGGRVEKFDGFLRAWSGESAAALPALEGSDQDREKGDVPDEDPDLDAHRAGAAPKSDGPEMATREEAAIDPENQKLPALKIGDTPGLDHMVKSQHFTTPPPRYTEASLIKKLEREGIGRPSTYASILGVIVNRNYVIREGRAFHASDLGVAVTDMLTKYFPVVMDIGFTREVEERLDLIEDQHMDWVKVLKEFYAPFAKQLKDAEENMTDSVAGTPFEKPCPKCGKQLLRYIGRFGSYVRCVDDQVCKFRASLGKLGEIVERKGPEKTDFLCPKCKQHNMERLEGRFGPFLRCPDEACKNTMSIGKDGQPREKKPQFKTDVPCPRCKRPMVIRYSRGGPFLGCQVWPRCRGTRRMIEEMRPQLEAQEKTVDVKTVIHMPPGFDLEKHAAEARKDRPPRPKGGAGRRGAKGAANDETSETPTGAAPS